MSNKLLLSAFLALLSGSCKERVTESYTKDIGQAGPGQTIIVFHMVGSDVFKRSCADYAATANPANCTSMANKSWSEFSSGLAKQNLPPAKIDELKGFLQNPSLMHAESATVKPYMSFIDAALLSSSPAPSGGKVTVPPPSGIDNPLDKVAVLAAMEQTRSTFNMAKGTIDACLANNVPDWSDIVIHYYCQHGNARACFTGKARDYKSKGLSGKEAYEKAYDDCTTNNDFKWIAQNQADVFRYLMFSVYGGGGVKTFNQADQDWVINKFYQVNDPADPAECNKRYTRANETRAKGRHCADGLGSSVPGSNIVLEQGSYKGVNLSSNFCKEDQVVEPELANGTMSAVKVGWCGSSFSGKFDCSGKSCQGPTSFVIEVMSPITYKFVMPNDTSVFSKVGGSSTGAGGSSITLKKGKYKGSNLNTSFCKESQIVDPITVNNSMTQIKFGWCGSIYSSTFDCNGTDCTGSNFDVKVKSSSQYTFTVQGHTATYDWESSSMTP